LIKISFDDKSYEKNHNFDDFKENREIKKIKINEEQQNHHYLRDGKFMELIHYDVTRLNYKKILTLRTKY
jgi:hypothetical protein